MKRCTPVTVALILLVLFAACAPPAPTLAPSPTPTAVATAIPTPAPPTVTPPPAPTAGELSDLGQNVYRLNCRSCHDFGYAPNTNRWVRRFANAQELYDYARQNMPPSNRGGLTAEEYFQIVAWVLVGYTVVPVDASLDSGGLTEYAFPK